MTVLYPSSVKFLGNSVGGLRKVSGVGLKLVMTIQYTGTRTIRAPSRRKIIAKTGFFVLCFAIPYSFERTFFALR